MPREVSGLAKGSSNGKNRSLHSRGMVHESVMFLRLLGMEEKCGAIQVPAKSIDDHTEPLPPETSVRQREMHWLIKALE
ncbi:MAG: hypothetical protein ACI9R3_002253 [Verrucomicrobiales bacterium]|jgi:hypothetical protein